MINLIEKKIDLGKEEIEVLGWKVSVSRRIWDQCVAIPKGVEGQSEENRFRDFLQQIRLNLKMLAAPRQGEICIAIPFLVNAASDDRGDSKLMDRFDGSAEEIPIAAFASFREDGSPNLLLLAAEEAMSLRVRNPHQRKRRIQH
jgi:hypothetical protein